MLNMTAAEIIEVWNKQKENGNLPKSSEVSIPQESLFLVLEALNDCASILLEDLDSCPENCNCWKSRWLKTNGFINK